MSKDLRRIVVVDVEATCWESEGDKGHPCYRGDSPVAIANARGEETEIIEIGVCELDLRTFERSKKTSILIAPVRSKVSPFCTRLTTLTQERLEAEGVPYLTAVERLIAEFKTKHAAWASWGAYDRSMFEREARRRATNSPTHVEELYPLYPWSRLHTNAKHLMSLVAGRFDGEWGLDHAVQVAGLPFEGTHHRGDDDAWNVAGVLAWMLRRTRGAFAEAGR